MIAIFKEHFLLYLVLSASIYVSCSNRLKISDQTKDTDNDSTIVLNWIGHWLGREGKERIVRDIAREYEFLNQKSNINLQFPQEIAKSEVFRPYLVDLYVTMIKTGKVDWDIIFLDHYLYAQISNKLNDPYWGSKYLVDFEKFDWFKESHKPFIIKDPFYRNMTGGTLVGPFIEGFYTALWYNKKMAEKIGIKIKNSGMNFEDFKEYLKKGFEYNQKTNDSVILLCPGENTGDPTNLLDALVISELDAIDTLDYTKNLKALKKGLDAIEELVIYKPTESYNKKTDQDVVLKGKGLFVIYSSWMYNRWKIIDKAEADNLIPAELPVFLKNGTAYQGTYQSVFAVFQNAPHRDKAIDLLKYLSKQENAENWLVMTKNPTGLKIRINSTDLTKDEIDVFNSTIDNKYGQNLYNFNLCQLLFGFKNRNIRPKAGDILNGKSTSKETYEKVLKQLKR